jgi:hypothetical protein
MTLLPTDTLGMLKQAAIAAEINYHHIDQSGVWWRRSHMSESVYCWNPLGDQKTNDALAAQFGITVHFDSSLGLAAAADLQGRVFRIGTDLCAFESEAALRRAVVYAVAHQVLAPA